MERLTYRNKNGEVCFAGEGTAVENFKLIPAILEKLAAYEDTGSPEEFMAYKDTGLTPEEIKSGINDATDLARIAIALRKLRRYEYAEQSGRNVALPEAPDGVER